MSAGDPLERISGVGSSPLISRHLRGVVGADLTRYAFKDARRVACLHPRPDDPTVVEADIEAVGEPMGLELGPFVFRTVEEARAFVEEVTVALEYLGCEIRAAPEEA